MTAFFPQILNSRLFKFTVGEDVDGTGSEFSLHEDSVAQLSVALEKMMKGGMGGKFSEAQAGATVWPDVRKETFECFAEFAYTCDYSIPKPIVRKSIEKNSDKLTSNEYPSPDPPLDPTPDEDFCWASLTTKKPKKQKSQKSKWFQEDEEMVPAVVEEIQEPRLNGPVLEANFEDLSYTLLAPRDHSATCDLSLPFSKTSSYSNILLCHATLYILADLWMIDSLKVLTLFKLHKTLCTFQLDDENAEDIVALARYAYQEEKGSDEGIGGLRNLVCQYMASNSVVLSLDEGFMDLLEEGGTLVRDLWKFEVQTH